jgi:transcriptional regulator with XRE-family HTH domain
MSPRDKHQTDTPNLELAEQMLDFGRAVQAARKAARLTQDKLASDWRYSRSVVANLENGRFNRPVYGRAHQTFCDLPIISEYEEERTLDDPARDDPQRDAIIAFEEMLLERTREVKTLMGTWHALWETEVEGKVVFNSEVLELCSMRARRRVMITNPRASLENPVGGYAWRAECRLVDGSTLLGIYAATSEENVSKGALQMRVHPHGRFIEGQWIGEGYDRPFARGRVVFCREREHLVHRMELLTGEPIDFSFSPDS